MVDRCTVCKQVGEDDWVQCDRCCRWVHFGCTEKTSDELRAQDSGFVCAQCETSVARPKRRRTEVNYARLDKGIMEVSQTHPHVQFFSMAMQREQTRPTEPETASNIQRFFTERNSRPTKVVKEWFHLLDMEIDAAQFTPRAIAATLGEDVKAPVMDSVTQLGVKGWTLGKWRDYHELGPQRRKNLTQHGTLNVITLEFSDTPLKQYVRRPRLVQEADLVDLVWPNDRPKPKVQLYSLTGAANSFTDFHIDFAGSSVFYHLISGSKSFIFVEPTSQNLRQYEKWCRSSDQSETWFPALLKNPSDAFQVDVQAGDSLLIPSGWIHSVYTPSDAVVVGGNFLTLKDMEMQKTIADLEERTNVPKQFRFPMFPLVLKYTEKHLLKTHADKNSSSAEAYADSFKNEHSSPSSESNASNPKQNTNTSSQQADETLLGSHVLGEGKN